MGRRWTGGRYGSTTASPKELTPRLLECTWEDPLLEVAEAAGMDQGADTGIATIMHAMITTGAEGARVRTGDGEVRAPTEGGATGAGAGATALAGGTTALGDTESSMNLCVVHIHLKNCTFCVHVMKRPFVWFLNKSEVSVLLLLYEVHFPFEWGLLLKAQSGSNTREPGKICTYFA